jgi:uncharacterized protein (DUF1810 family)
VVAQASTFDGALEELRAGRKRSYWMWFVFPQLRGLGHSPMSNLYGIASLQEAHSYLAHPILGQRLRACTEAVLAHRGRTLAAIFGSPDDLKFSSSMTLFEAAAFDPAQPFTPALDQFCGGVRDERTLRLLREAT